MVQDNTDKSGHIVVAIAGYARTGKDTIADAIFDISESVHPEYCVLVAKFADSLKQSVQDALEDLDLEVDVFTENTDQKANIRPLLVAYGEFCRSVDKNVWVDRVIEGVTDWVHEAPTGLSLTLIPDMRYANEYDKLEAVCKKNNWTFVPVYISRVGQGPANAEEARSINEMLDSDRFSKGNATTLVFEDGDVQGIHDYATRFVDALDIYLRT
jgi:hypothetical protein